MFTPQEVKRRRGQDKGIEVSLNIEKPPANAAFEVLARVGGKEHRITTIAHPAGASTNHGFGSFDLPRFDGDRLDLILRSSDEALRETVDMYLAWRGEIVIENVQVEDDTR